MKSRKIMRIDDCILNLPDDFEGTILDALKLLVQYREEAEYSNLINRHENEIDNYDILWDNDNIRVAITYGFAELNEDETDWIYDVDWIKK